MAVEINRSLQTIAVLVENKAGVLARVADLFARRGYNIHTLTVAPTSDAQFSRITIVVNVDSAPLDQIVKQLFKLIHVVEIQELILESAVEREMIIANVEAPDSSSLVNLIEANQGKVLSEAMGQVTLSIEANPSQLDQFEIDLAEFKVVSLQRSGRIALPKIGTAVPKHTANT